MSLRPWSHFFLHNLNKTLSGRQVSGFRSHPHATIGIWWNSVPSRLASLLPSFHSKIDTTESPNSAQNRLISSYSVTAKKNNIVFQQTPHLQAGWVRRLHDVWLPIVIQSNYINRPNPHTNDLHPTLFEWLWSPAILALKSSGSIVSSVRCSPATAEQTWIIRRSPGIRRGWRGGLLAPMAARRKHARATEMLLRCGECAQSRWAKRLWSVGKGLFCWGQVAKWPPQNQAVCVCELNICKTTRSDLLRNWKHNMLDWPHALEETLHTRDFMLWYPDRSFSCLRLTSSQFGAPERANLKICQGPPSASWMLLHVSHHLTFQIPLTLIHLAASLLPKLR